MEEDINISDICMFKCTLISMYIIYKQIKRYSQYLACSDTLWRRNGCFSETFKAQGRLCVIQILCRMLLLASHVAPV